MLAADADQLAELAAELADADQLAELAADAGRRC